MSDSQPNNQMPDIDAGLSGIASETTAGALLKQQGQRKKIKVMRESALRGFINSAMTSVMADNSRVSDEERQRIAADMEQRVQTAMKEAAKRETEAKAMSEERELDLQRQLTHAREQAGDSEALNQALEELQRRVKTAESAADEARADLMSLQGDLENTQRMLQQSINQRDVERQEREREKEVFREHMLRTTDLVQLVFNLDRDHYAGRHQEQFAIDEEAEATIEDQLFNDFKICIARLKAWRLI